MQSLVSETIANTEDCINASIDDDLLVSYVVSLCVVDGELNSSFLKADDKIAKKPIYENMKWFDARNWEDDVAYGSNQIEKLASHFKATLEKANFH